MANSLTAFNKEEWAREMQTVFHRQNVAIALANTEFRNLLNTGDTINKPYRSYLSVSDYTKGTDVTVQDITSTNEQLSVDTAKIVPFYVDDLDKIQNSYDAAMKFAQDAQVRLNNVIDAAILDEYSNASSDVDAGDVGGSAGSTLTLSTSNVLQVMTAAWRKLDDFDIPSTNRFWVVGPRQLEVVRQYIGGKDTSLADIVLQNGKVGNLNGFEVYFSNSLPFSARWTPADNPSESATVGIAGVTFTFNATPSGAGSVDLGGNTATSIDNLVAAINDAGTAGTTYIQLSAISRQRLGKRGVVATDGTTYLGITGYGDIVVTTSESADVWSLQTQHGLAGMKGATDLLIQKTPNVDFRQDPDRLGRNVFAWSLYGKKTFTDKKDALVDINYNVSAWT